MSGNEADGRTSDGQPEDHWTDQEEQRRIVPRVRGQKPVTKASSRTVTAVLVAIVIFVYLIRSILLPFVIAGAVAYVCTPLIDRIVRRTRMPRGAAAGLVFVAVLALFGGLGYLAVPSVVDEVKGTADNLQGIIQKAAAGALGTGHVTVFGQGTDAAEIAKVAMADIKGAVLQGSVLGRIAIDAFASMFGLLLTLVMLFYFMAGGPSIGRGLFWLVPPKQRPIAHAMWRELDPVLIRYFTGVAVVVLYASVAAYIGLGLFLHLKNAVVLAALTGLLEMIPVVGPGASAVIAGLAALRTSDGVGEVIGYIAYAVILRISIDQFVGPIVLGRAGRVHPTLIIFCFLVGGVLFGIPGVIMAIPVALTVKTVLAILYEEAPEEGQSSAGRAVA